LSTNARKLYVSYLSTEALLAARDEAVHKMRMAVVDNRQREAQLWRDIYEDLWREFLSRQLTIADELLHRAASEQVSADVGVEPGADSAAQERDDVAGRDDPPA